MAECQWLRSAHSYARILSTCRPLVRRWPTFTVGTATMNHDVCGFDVQMRRKLTTNSYCSAASYCKHMPLHPIAPSMCASVLSHPSRNFSPAAIRLGSSTVAGKGSAVTRSDSTNAAARSRSFTTVRGGGKWREREDGRERVARTRIRRKPNR